MDVEVDVQTVATLVTNDDQRLGQRRRRWRKRGSSLPVVQQREPLYIGLFEAGRAF